MSSLLRKWWAWSTGPGKRRKVAGFGVPALVAVAVVLALTPEPPEEIDDRFAPPTAVGASPTATAARSPSAGVGATATVVASAAALSQTPAPPPFPDSDAGEGPGQDGRERAVVAGVVDGDTVVLDDDRRLRYIGIDTPETVAPGRPVACYGPEASARNEALVLGQVVWLEADVSDTDRYDRLLRYVYLEDGRMVNEVLVLEGYATSYPYEPDTKHQDVLDAAEEHARVSGLGLWAACPVEPDATATPEIGVTVPPSGSQGECPLGCEAPPEGCSIKGNISSEHIYHLPGQQHYEDTIIDPEKGERWFCTEDEAVANGWRKALR